MRNYNEILSAIKAHYIAATPVRERYNITDPDATFDGTFSRFSVESIWASVLAMITHTIEALFYQHIADVSAREEQMRVGTLSWWRQLCLSWQYGHDLVYNDDTNVFEYAEIDNSAALIKFAEVREGEMPGILVLVNKADESGNPVPMSDTDERNAFAAYLAKTKLAGIPVTWGSYNPDRLSVSVSVRYNPLILTGAGTLIGTEGITVEDSIKEYLRTLPYGSGVINKTHIIDAVQRATGVIDAYTTSASWLQVATDTSPSYTPVAGQNLQSYGGSFALDNLVINYHV